MTTTAPPTAPRRRDWRCRFLASHRYVVRSTDDGGRYRSCARCGHEDIWTSPGAPVVFG